MNQIYLHSGFRTSNTLWPHYPTGDILSRRKTIQWKRDCVFVGDASCRVRRLSAICPLRRARSTSLPTISTATPIAFDIPTLLLC